MKFFLILLLAQSPAPGIPSVDFSPALNLLETVRLLVDPKTGKVVKRRRTKAEIAREKACGSLLHSAQAIAHTLR